VRQPVGSQLPSVKLAPHAHSVPSSQSASLAQRSAQLAEATRRISESPAQTSRSGVDAGSHDGHSLGAGFSQATSVSVSSNNDPRTNDTSSL
jgi:hypothetical protein